MTALGLVGGKLWEPRDINESGQIVGVNQTPNGAIWTPDTPRGITGSAVAVPPLPTYDNSDLRANNDAGDAVGESSRHGFNPTAYYYHAGNTTSLPPADDSSVFDINSEGRSVGWSPDELRHIRATIWANGTRLLLEELTPSGGGRAYSLNDAGNSVGEATIAGGGTGHAVRWSKSGAAEDISLLIPGNPHSGRGLAINNLDHVIGTIRFGDGPQRGYFWGEGDPVDIGTFGDGGLPCFPDDINDSDQIVGTVGLNPAQPFIYEDGQMTDLNTLIDPDSGFLLTAATGINNAGQIIGLAATGPVLLTPFSLLPADLAVTLTAAPSPALMGRNLTYSGTVKNNGPNPAASTEAVFTLPAGVELVSASPSATQSGNELHFDLGTLADEQSVAIEVVVVPTTTGTLSGKLTAKALGSDPGPGVNTVTRNVTAIRPSVDISVSLTTAPNPVIVGQNLTLNGKVKNSGPHSTANATAAINIPSGYNLVSVTPNATDIPGGLLFDLGTLADEQVADLQIVLTPTAPGVAEFHLEAHAPETDPAASNNQVIRSVTARALTADVQVAGTATPSTVEVGGTITYRFGVKNLGPDPATGVRLVMALAENGTDIRFQSMETDRGTTGREGQDIFAHIGTLAKGESALVTIVAVAVAPTTEPLRRKATVSLNESDPKPETNEVSPAVTIKTPLRPNLTGHWDELRMKKKGKGKNLKYVFDATARISNTGNAAAGASKLRFFLSTDQTLGKDDVPLSVKVNGQELPVEIPVNALAAGASQSIPVTGIKVSKKDYNAKLKGKFLLGVVDFAGTVAESNESDNVFPGKGDKATPL